MTKTPSIGHLSSDPPPWCLECDKDYRGFKISYRYSSPFKVVTQEVCDESSIETCVDW